MMERGIWPMLRLVLLGSQRRSMPLVCSLWASPRIVEACS